jgi:hypothetical protein
MVVQNIQKRDSVHHQSVENDFLGIANEKRGTLRNLLGIRIPVERKGVVQIHVLSLSNDWPKEIWLTPSIIRQLFRELGRNNRPIPVSQP